MLTSEVSCFDISPPKPPVALFGNMTIMDSLIRETNRGDEFTVAGKMATVRESVHLSYFLGS
jgi:hypothetical protein